MSEQNSAPTTEPTTATEPVNTPSTAAQSAPAAVNVDIDAIALKATEQAEKKMQAVFRSMLEQQGIKDIDAINNLTAEWKSKQQTPEQIAAEKDNEIARLTNALTAAQNNAVAAAKGVPAGLIADYVTLAAAQVGDDFSAKLDAALAKFPLPKKDTPPPYPAGTGQQPVLGAKPLKEMTYMEEMALKRSNPELYKTLK